MGDGNFLGKITFRVGKIERQKRGKSSAKNQFCPLKTEAELTEFRGVYRNY